MGAKKLILMDLFRILTPEEIGDLTNSSGGSERIDLTLLLERKLEGLEDDFGPDSGGAKILPFKKPGDDEEDVEEIIVAGEIVQEFVERFFLRQQMKETAIDEKGEAVETSSFILNEKQRFKYSQSKLKEKEILGLYQVNARVDLEQEKMIKDDMSKSTKVGVLVNKKQF